MNYNVMAYSYKKRLIINLLLNVLLIFTFVAAAILLVLYSHIFWVSVICFAVFAVVLLLLRVIKRKLPTVYTFTRVKGVISKVNIDVKNVRETKVGSVGLVKRPFDHDRRDLTVCKLFVQTSEDKLRCVRFEDVSRKHCEYYKAGDEVLRLPGTRFPILLNCKEEEMICPVCGEFGNYSEDVCQKCGINFKGRDVRGKL